MFAHVLAGAIAGGGGGELVVFPGVGFEVGRQRTAVRIQLDWPLITTSGIYTDLPRFSAGVVFRPGLSR